MPGARPRPTISRSSRTGAPRPGRGPTTSASTSTTCRRSPTGSPRSLAAPPASSSARASVPGAAWSATKRTVPSDSCGRTTTPSRSPRSHRARRSKCGSSRAGTMRTSAVPRTPISPPPAKRFGRCSGRWQSRSTIRPTTSSSTRRRCASRSTRRTTGTGRFILVSGRSPASSSGPASRSTRSRPRTQSRSWLHAPGSSARSARRLPADGSRAGGRAASHNEQSPRLWATKRTALIRRLDPSTVGQGGCMVGALDSRIGVSRGFGGGAAVSGAWEQDVAAVFVEELFAAHHNEIYAYPIRMLRDSELAADLTQDAFVKAYRNYNVLEKPENARAWLYQIAHRVALDELRRRKIVRFLPWTGESHGAAPSAEHMAMELRLSGDLQRALNQIPERQRAALLLAELHDLTGLELAAALGVSHVAARALLTRARESLRQALATERAADAQAEADAEAASPLSGDRRSGTAR